MSELRVSVTFVVPACNCQATLPACLEALLRGSAADAEIIVVDDASSDATRDVAGRYPVRLISLEKRSGPAFARNRGAAAARGDVLFFVDSDVILGAGSVERVGAILAGDPAIAAVFGSYDDRPAAKGVVSQYRNLLHHYTHQFGDPEASTFWAGCGAVRRSCFEAVGGFDAERFPRPSVEDIDLGYRVRDAGFRIRLDRDLQATHLKRWTFRSMLRTDVSGRALEWSRLLLERPQAQRDLNISGSQRMCGGLVVLAAIALAATPRVPAASLLAAGALLLVVLINRRFYAYLAARRTPQFALAAVFLHLVYFYCCVVGFGVARLERLWRPRGRGRREPLSALPTRDRSDLSPVTNEPLAGQMAIGETE